MYLMFKKKPDVVLQNFKTFGESQSTESFLAQG